MSEQIAVYNAILASGISSTKAIGDGGGTSYIWIGAPAGIEKLEDAAQLSIYANPTSDGIYVNATGMVYIYNMEGQKMLSKEISGNTYVPITNLPNAVYIVQIETTEGVSLQKLIKK